jgi:hypothetical protein
MPQAELEMLLRAAPPVAPERLRTRVRCLREPAPRQFPSLRRLALPALAAVAVAVVGAAAIHGVVRSDATHPTAAAKQPARVRRTLAPLPEQHALDRGGSTSAGVGSTFAPHVAAIPSVGGGSRLTQVVASLRLRVGESALSKVTGEATRLARSFGGYAASVDYRTPQSAPAQAFLELRIPTQEVQAALTRLGGLGTILSQRISARDLQTELERQTAQIAELRQEIKLTLAGLRDPSLPEVQRIELQLKLNQAKHALAQRLHARKGTIAAGTLSRISLVLTTERHAAAASHPGRLHRMLGNAASFLGLEGTVALYVLIVLAPLLPFAAAWWWLRRRRDARLLALP